MIPEERIFPAILKGSLFLLVVLTLTGFAFSPKTGMGILGGGLISIMNFLWMRNVLQRILGLMPARPQLYAQLRYVARLTVSALMIYGMLVSGWFSLVGLLVGLSIIVINVIALSLYCALRTGG